jgi:putative ABC transport system permease protein
MDLKKLKPSEHKPDCMRTMIWSISWKNVWRSKTRSLVVIVAVLLGIFVGTMVTGFMQGWINQRIHDVIYNEISHVQVHNPDYLFNEELQFTVKDYAKVTGIIDTMKDVIAWSPRVKMFVMAQSDWAVTGFALKGVDVEKEKQVSEVYKNMVAGDFLEGKYKVPSIVIGSEAAKNLKLLNYELTSEKLDSIDHGLYPAELIAKIANMGSKRYRKEKDFRALLEKSLTTQEYARYSDKLVDYFSFYRMNVNIRLTVLNKDGETITPVYKVRGIYKTSNSMFDGLNAFVDRKLLNQYIGLDSHEVHEIAILAVDNKTGASIGGKLAGYIPENNVMSWRKLSPEIAMYTEYSNFIGYIYIGIILLALAFGIINTMLMSVLERLKELGMLMAIGMNKKRVFSMIMLESVFLTLTGAIVGLFFSGIAIHITNRTGINLSMWSEGLEAIGYSSVVYPVVTIDNYIGILILVIFTGIISSIWPARKALKLNPVEALRTE